MMARFLLANTKLVGCKHCSKAHAASEKLLHNHEVYLKDRFVQARYQLGIPSGAKIFLRGSQNF